MADVKEVAFVPAVWGPKVEGWLEEIDGWTDHTRAMREAIISGEYQAFVIEVNGANIGAMVWSIDEGEDGKIIVVNALSAMNVEGLDVSETALNFICQTGRMAGAHSIRFETMRAGLVRKMEKRGFKKRFVMQGKL